MNDYSTVRGYLIILSLFSSVMGSFLALLGGFASICNLKYSTNQENFIILIIGGSLLAFNFICLISYVFLKQKDEIKNINSKNILTEDEITKLLNLDIN